MDHFSSTHHDAGHAHSSDASHGTHHELSSFSYNVGPSSNYTAGTEFGDVTSQLQTPSDFILPDTTSVFVHTEPSTSYTGILTDPAPAIQWPGINWNAVMAGK